DDDERAVGVYRPDATSVAGDVVAQPAHTGRTGINLALDRGPLVGRGATEGTVASAGLHDEHEAGAVAFETFQGRPRGLNGPLDEGLGVGHRPLLESLDRKSTRLNSSHD